MKPTLLRTTLRLNALVTGLFAVLLLAFKQPLASLMGGFDPAWLGYLAYGLLGFVGLVLYVSEQKPIPPRQAAIIAYMDEAWVLGSILLMLFASSWFTTTGLVLIAITTVVVAGFAYFEARGIRQLKLNAA